MFRTVDEAIHFIEAQRINSTSLKTFKELLAKHDNFHRELLYVHVTGTNGKGSTSKMISDSLILAGYDVGLFTSPHMVVSNDRVRLNNQYIPDETLTYYVNYFHEDILEYQLNFFQIYTLLALKYFYDSHCHLVVMEVGIGGLLDSTNIVDGIISIITTISMDHTDKLGKTIEEIAYQKAGIIKKDNHTITMVNQESALSIIRDKTIKENSSLHILTPVPSKKAGRSREFQVLGDNYKINSLASYQVNNALVAIKALEILKSDYNFEVKTQDIKEALESFEWYGRYELVSKNPNIILDGAHNMAGIEALINEGLHESVVIFSALKDKEYMQMLKALKIHAKELVFSEFDFYRALKIDDLADVDVLKFSDFSLSLDYVKSKYPNHDVIICGSLYFISEVRVYFTKRII